MATDSGAMDVGQIMHAADRAAGLTKQLLAFSRREAIRPEVLELNVVVSEMGALVRQLVEEAVEIDVS